MIIAILAPALAAAADECPKHAPVESIYDKAVTLYNLDNTVAGQIKMAKGVADPPLVVIACAGREYIVRRADLTGPEMMVSRLDVVVDQNLTIPVCHPRDGDTEGHVELRGMHANDPTCQEPGATH